MTTTKTDGNKIILSLEVSVEYDGDAGGFLVCEQDGPHGHVIKWGPMPGFLVQAFIRERGEYVAATWRRLADEVVSRS